MPGSSPPVRPRVLAPPRQTPKSFQRKRQAKFFIPEQNGVSLQKGGRGSRGPWVGKTEPEGDAEEMAKEKGNERPKEEMRRALTVKTRADRRDAELMGPHSKNGLAAFPHPNRPKPHERGEAEFETAETQRRIRRKETGREAWKQRRQRRKRGKVANRSWKGAAQEGTYKRPRNGMLGRQRGKAQSVGISGMPREVRDTSRRLKRWGGGRPGVGAESGGSVLGPGRTWQNRSQRPARRTAGGAGGWEGGCAAGEDGMWTPRRWKEKGSERGKGLRERRGRSGVAMGEGREDAGIGLREPAREGAAEADGSVTSGLPVRRAAPPEGCGLRNSPALSPALPCFSGGGGGGGRDSAAHSGGFSAPGLGCCVLGGGGSGGGSGPTRAVTIVRDSMRSRAEPLSSRRQPWLLALAPPAPSTLQRPRPGSRALRLRAAPPARRAPPPPPRAPARQRSLTIASTRVSASPPVHGRDTHAFRGPHSQALAAMETCTTPPARAL